MKRLTLYLLLSFILAFLFTMEEAWATHNRAGEISYVSEPMPGNPYCYRFIITTYTKTGGESNNADRDSLDINFGDGSPIVRAPRINGIGNPPKGELLPGANAIKKNIYEISHCYSAPFDYIVSMQDPNRIADIINIGNSVDIPFYIESCLRIRSPQFFGYNDSPILYQPPIDNATVFQPFIHNPNAFDPDGDSLLFEMAIPRMAPDKNVPLYQFPDEVSPSPDNTMSLDPATGEFIWDAPQVEGIYNIAFRIREFRNGLEIGCLVRDMQVIVERGDNEPPEIQAINDTCIQIGQTLEVPVQASDPNESPRNIILSAWGGPLEVENSPAVLEVEPVDIGDETINAVFKWETVCDHIYSQKYTVVIKADDSGDPILSDLETWQIALSPPAPQELKVEIIEGDVVLAWNTETPYACAESDKFRGFSIWRSIGCDSLEMGNCQLGLQGTSYVKIADGIKEFTYVDDAASKGIVYSYRVVGEYADAFTNGNPPSPLNLISSVPSQNACVELPKDAPIILNASVENTATTEGSIFVAWTKPVAEVLDTTINKAPYVYELYRSQGIGSTDFILVNSWTYDGFYLANDTTYQDQAPELNTQDFPYVYKIAFYANEDDLIDETSTASTIFLNINAADNALELEWEVQVPWLNESYVIFRQNAQGDFDSIATVINTNTFTDEGLANGAEYCYKVKGIGTYSSDGLPDPLINYSQISCANPIDTIAPCEPVLRVTNACDTENTDGGDALFNTVTWQLPSGACGEDVVVFNLYFSEPLSDDYELLSTFSVTDQYYYLHELETSLAGCYRMTAIDSFANESIFSNIECKENCLTYELPNTFTPNNDQQNDIFRARNAIFVSRVDMRIFNRWGNLVYQTNDPLINWEGKDLAGKDLAEGVYYYVCDVLSQSSTGSEVVEETQSGYIHLIRGQ